MNKTLRRLLFSLAALAMAAFGGLQLAQNDPAPAVPLTEETTVHFIDVGQGDAALILSGGEAVLIDAGTGDSADSLVSYLTAQGVTRFSAVIATHPHADHIGGMAKVLDAFPVENFYLGRETASTKTYSRMLDALEAQGITPTVPQDGDRFAFSSGAALTFLGPADDVSADEMNDRSLITLLTAGEHSVLFMGDAETAAEQSLLAHHPSLSCEVLKVGHHGSATSSSPDFLQAVHPSVAVISCGVDNDYGHPSAKTLQNLTRAGVTDIRITAETGTVILPLDPSSSGKENAA